MSSAVATIALKLACMCVLFAFVIAMQMHTHTTYLKVMKHALSVCHRVLWENFQSTLVRMYPVVTALVDSMHNDTSKDMRQTDQSKLGLKSHASMPAGAVRSTS